LTIQGKEPPRTLQWHNGHDHLGWHREGDGTSFLGLFVPYGRIKDTETMQLKSVLRDLVLEFRPTVRFTAQQNVILSGIPDELRPAVEERLRSAGVPLPQELLLAPRWLGTVPKRRERITEARIMHKIKGWEEYPEWPKRWRENGLSLRGPAK